MPNRILKESIKTSAQVDALSWFEEVVFYRLMVTADDYGCVDGRTILLRNELFPTKDTVTKKAVEDAITHLTSVGLLCRYTVNGMPYLLFPTWEKHQRVRNKRRKYPEPPAEAFDRDLLSNDGQMTASCPPESESESNPNPREETIVSSCGEPETASPPVATLALISGAEYAVTQEQADKWQQLYPAVDVLQELRNMVGWCDANPKQRKTRNGVNRFINGWLEREQNKTRRPVRDRGGHSFLEDGI